MACDTQKTQDAHTEALAPQLLALSTLPVARPNGAYQRVLQAKKFDALSAIPTAQDGRKERRLEGGLATIRQWQKRR